MSTQYGKNEVLALLDELGLPYRLLDHPAVYNMEEMQACGIDQSGPVAKNLFLKDAKGKTHYLVCLPLEKRANLATLAGVLQSSRLGFASEERLVRFLGVHHGAVSPLGVLNDASHTVQVVLDSQLLQWSEIGMHPNDNTATVWLTPENLLALLARTGNPVATLAIPDGDPLGQ